MTNNALALIDDLLDASVAETHDLGYGPVAQARRAGLADRRVTLLTRSLVPGDGADELSLVIGHAKKCTENLTGEGVAYRFLYMTTTEMRQVIEALNVPAQGTIGNATVYRNQTTFSVKYERGAIIDTADVDEVIGHVRISNGGRVHR